MTLIMGLNLSDKIYTAADTRITLTPGGEKVDNIMKISTIWGKRVYPQPFYDKNTLEMAVAGDLSFASFFHDKIIESLHNKKLPSDVRELWKRIDDFGRKVVDLWLQEGGEYQDFCAIFSGSSGYRNKMVEPEILNKLKEKYEESQARDIPKGINSIKDALDRGDKTMIGLSKAILRDKGKDIFKVMEENYEVVIPPHLETEDGELNGIPDSLVFGIRISMKNGIFQTEKAEWGELLAYGTNNITKADIGDDILSRFEISRNPANLTHLMEAGMLTVSILDIAKKEKIDAIGGTVIITAQEKGEIKIMSKDLVSKPGDRIRIKMGPASPELVLFNKFNEVLPNIKQAKL
jgi:hypothetical protein